MKATITDRKPKFTTSHRKEKAGLHKCYAMLIPSRVAPSEAYAVVEMRIYWPGDTTVYACLWVGSYATEFYASGSGKAGGHGYCKISGAAHDAIHNAGFDLSESIHGHGTSAIREALRAIAEAVGHPEAMLFETHP